MKGILSGGSASPLVVRTQGSDRSLPAGPSYLVGRDPQCDIVIDDARVSSHHAVLRLEGCHWVLADNGSTNGTYAGDQRVDRIEINGECLVRLSDPADGPVLSCAVSGTASSGAPTLWPEPVPSAHLPGVVWPPPAKTLRIGREPDNDIVLSDPSVSSHHAELRNVAGGYRIVDLGSTNGTFVNEQRVTAALLSEGDIVGFGDSTFRLVGRELQEYAGTHAYAEEAPLPVAGSPGASDDALEIPYAIRWLVPKGERFANFDILNDNDTQLDYYRRFGHIYAVGIPTKKWRLVVVSDPELLDEVAADEEQFGKRVEEINFFAQLSNSRGGGISVIGDGEHYERVRRVMLPWYAPSHQRTQLERMKEQARKLVAAWSAIPDDEPLDARDWMERYTLEVSGRGACNYDFGLLGRGQRRSTPVRGGRSGEHEGEHPARRRASPRLHGVRRARARARAEALPPSQQGAVQDGRRARPGTDAHVPARPADGSAQPSGEHAGSRDGRASRPRDHPRPDPHAPLERLQRAVDHRSVARLCPRHAPGRRGEADRRDRRDHRRRPRLRPAVRRPDGADVHDPGDQGDDADLPADADHDPPQPQGRDARPLSRPQGRHHPRRDARRAARPALLGPGPGQVRSGAVRDGEGRRTGRATRSSRSRSGSGSAWRKRSRS